MLVKVKEPQPGEVKLFRKGQILYTYLHLAANKSLTESLIKKCVPSVADETIEDESGHLPCLQPMSEIAGRLAVQEGAKYLEKTFGGRGILLGGVPGVSRGRIAILGGGIVGTHACKMAVGIGAQVTVLDINARRMAYLDDIFGSSITTLTCTATHLESILEESDVIIGAVLIPGAATPKLIRREHLKRIQKGSVLVDVAIDQGGCFESSRPTTHNAPTYIEQGIVHCVANMPGAVALSSTPLPYGQQIADEGLEPAVQSHPGLRKGLNIYNGNCVYKAVAESLGLPHRDLKSLLSA